MRSWGLGWNSVYKLLKAQFIPPQNGFQKACRIPLSIKVFLLSDLDFAMEGMGRELMWLGFCLFVLFEARSHVF